MNKKAQLDSAAYFVMSIAFMILVWVYMVNPVIQQRIPDAIAANNITGLEAFFYQNLSLFFFITMFLAVIGYAAYMRNAMKVRRF